MPHLATGGPAVPPAFAAGLLLVSLSLLDDLGLQPLSASQVISACGASRSAAYEQRSRLLEALPGLARPSGRPPKTERAPQDTAPITREVLDFLMTHPGAVSRTEHRSRYSDGFRHLVLDLAERHQEVELDDLADATRIPLGTLKDWLAGERTAVENTTAPNLAEQADRVTQPRLMALLEAWDRWRGTFEVFCDHVQQELRLPYGQALIRDILHAEGVRIPKGRPGRRNPDAEAIRGQMHTFFAGAQWVGDGSPWTVMVAGQPYTFNLELVVDAHTAAVTGVSVRDEEDGAALVEAFDDGTDTTGESPLALLVDNRPSNHTEEVVEALGDTIKVRATPGRPENKAHVEGAFGLFEQTAPKLRIDSLEPRELARSVLTIAALTWARTLNHVPREDREGRSRVDLYRLQDPTPEEVAQARAALQELARKQEEARERQAARLDPAVRAYVDEAFDELGLSDPDGHFRAALARYPADAVVTGLAIFRAKRAKGTLPEGADARYLLGIVRNVAHEDEGWAIALALLGERLAVRDRVLAGLERQREREEEGAEGGDELLARLVDLAMGERRRIPRAFWLRAAADVLEEDPPSERARAYKVAARRIWATHKAPKMDRLAATRRLAAMAFPMA